MPVQRAGFNTVTPRIVVEDAADLIRFLEAVFGAEDRSPSGDPAEMGIGDSLIMVSSSGEREQVTAFLYVYVDDVELTHRTALGAGATSREEPFDTPYGDRRAMFEDRFGNLCQVGSVIDR